MLYMSCKKPVLARRRSHQIVFEPRIFIQHLSYAENIVSTFQTGSQTVIMKDDRHLEGRSRVGRPRESPSHSQAFGRERGLTTLAKKVRRSRLD